MAHFRQQIRAAVVARLAAGVAGVGGRVYANRLHPLGDAELPAISVEINDDQISQQTPLDPPTYLREAVVDVVIKAKSVTGVDDLLDDLCAEVEPLMHDLPALGLVVLFERTAIGLSDDQERLLGEARLTYRIPYQTEAADPATEA